MLLFYNGWLDLTAHTTQHVATHWVIFEENTLLKGELIKIRNVREADLNEFYTLCVDFDDPGEFMPLSFVSEVSFKAEFMETGFWKDHCGRLIIEDVSGHIIGEAGFFKTTHYIDGREIYYRIFSGHRGKGYASEALGLLVKFFFEATSMNRIQAVTVLGNDVSEYMLKNGAVVGKCCLYLMSEAN
jgi:ribosomal-protein-alanine N-acetyltransferase